MPSVIFLDSSSRVVGHAASPSYTEAPDPMDQNQVFVGDTFLESNMMRIYDRSTGKYIADAVSEEYHNPSRAVDEASA